MSPQTRSLYCGVERPHCPERQPAQFEIRGAGARVDEVLRFADRVLVVFNGMVREVSRDRDRVGRAMMGTA
jgi:hypothetical protein